MADEKTTVTVSHPVTGTTREVSRERAENLRGMGWSVTEPTPRRVAPPDEPDVEAGKAKLAAATGEKPQELHLARTAKKTAKKTARQHAAGAQASEPPTPPPPPESPEEAVSAAQKAEARSQLESEAGHAGLQVDKGASNA